MIRATKKTGDFMNYVTITAGKEDEEAMQYIAYRLEKLGFIPAHKLYFTPTRNERIRLDYALMSSLDMQNLLKAYHRFKHMVK